MQQEVNREFENLMTNIMYRAEDNYSTSFNYVNIQLDRLLRELQRIYSRYRHYSPEDRTMLIRRDLALYRPLERHLPNIASFSMEYALILEQALNSTYDETVTAYNEILYPYIGYTQVMSTDRRNVVVNGSENNYNPRNNIPLKTSQFLMTLRWTIETALNENWSYEQLQEAVGKKKKYYEHRLRQATWTEVARVVNMTISLMTFRSGVEYVQWLDATEQVTIFRSGRGGIAAVCADCHLFANGGIDGRGIYPRNELPAPIPAHPNCRCIIVPVVSAT